MNLWEHKCIHGVRRVIKKSDCIMCARAEIRRLQAVEELLRQAFDGEVTYDDFGEWYDKCVGVFGRVSQTHEEVSDGE